LLKEKYQGVVAGREGRLEKERVAKQRDSAIAERDEAI